MQHELGSRALAVQKITTLLATTLIAIAPGQSAAHDWVSVSPVDSDYHFSQLRNKIELAAQELVGSVDGPRSELEKFYGYSKSESLLEDFDSPGRSDWSYWPRDRAGLELGMMSAPQRILVQNLLATLLSSAGYMRVNHIMMLESILYEQEESVFLRGAHKYTITVFGKPSPRSVWSLRFEGHHISINATLTPERIFLTPSFVGASPARRTAGPYAGFQPMRYEQALAFELFRTLDDMQREEAILSTSAPGDILSTQFQKPPVNWNQWRDDLSPDGVSSRSFTPAQRLLLQELVQEVTGLYADELSAPYRDQIDLDEISFAWMGSSVENRAHYFRLQHGNFVFEFDASQEEAMHIHTVWRDRREDFGENALFEHYRASEHHRRER